MSVSTQCRLRGYIKIDEVLQFIKNHYDKDVITFGGGVSSMGPVKEYSYIRKVYDDSGDWLFEETNFKFKFHGITRQMFYSYSNVNTYENMEYYKSAGLEYMVKEEYTFLSLGCNDDAVIIMTDLANYFGGWVDRNDCDLTPFELINFGGTRMKDLTLHADDILDYDELNKSVNNFINTNYRYKAEYFFRDPVGSTFSNDDHFSTIGYGTSKEELEKFCEEKGFNKSTTEFDGGYTVKEINIHVEERPKHSMINKKSWREFKETGLLWFINTILHTFGWALVVEVDDESDYIRTAYPARVKFRGFGPESTERGYINVSKYMAENAEELLKEAKDE